VKSPHDFVGSERFKDLQKHNLNPVKGKSVVFHVPLEKTNVSRNSLKNAVKLHADDFLALLLIASLACDEHSRPASPQLASHEDTIFPCRVCHRLKLGSTCSSKTPSWHVSAVLRRAGAREGVLL
jgi:hypothetical protein